VVDVGTGELIERRPVDEFPTAGALSPDGGLVVGNLRGRVVIDRAGDRIDLEAHIGEVLHVVATEDLITSAGADDVVRFWSTDGTAVSSALSVPGEVSALAHAPGPLVLIALSDGGYWVVDVAGNPLVERRWPVALSQVGPDLSFYEAPTGDGLLQLRRLSDDELVRTIDDTDVLPNGPLDKAFYSSDGGWIMTYDGEGTVVFTEIDGDGRQVVDMDSVYEAITGDEVRGDPLTSSAPARHR
jgi:hypothetical protein